MKNNKETFKYYKDVFKSMSGILMKLSIKTWILFAAYFIAVCVLSEEIGTLFIQNQTRIPLLLKVGDELSFSFFK